MGRAPGKRSAKRRRHRVAIGLFCQVRIAHVVSGFDDFAHRMGLSRAMSRGLFLPVRSRAAARASVSQKSMTRFTSSWSASLKLTANLRFQRATISSQNARLARLSCDISPSRPLETVRGVPGFLRAPYSANRGRQTRARFNVVRQMSRWPRPAFALSSGPKGRGKPAGFHPIEPPVAERVLLRPRRWPRNTPDAH